MIKLHDKAFMVLAHCSGLIPLGSVLCVFPLLEDVGIYSI